MRVKRVGSVTLGLSLVILGGLFLAHVFFPTISYLFIFKLWPIGFIILGLEVLATTFSIKNISYIYDKAAIFLTILLTFFLMVMAVFSQTIEFAVKW